MQKTLEQAEAAGGTQSVEHLRALLEKKKVSVPASPLSGTRAYFEATNKKAALEKRAKKLADRIAKKKKQSVTWKICKPRLLTSLNRWVKLTMRLQRLLLAFLSLWMHARRLRLTVQLFVA